MLNYLDLVGHPKNRCGSYGFYFNGRNESETMEAWAKFKKENLDLMKEIFFDHDE